MSRRLRFVLLFLAVALPLAAQQKKIGEVTLFGEEQLKVEAATKTEIPISKAPSAVTVITAKQIQESGARTVADLLRLVGGVNVRWNPMTPTIDIRGFGEMPFSTRVLLLVDGVPFNSADTGGFPLSPNFDFFPIQNIKRIEVVKGPGSSLYGENAFWGVINLVTLSGEDLEGGSGQLFGGSRSTGSATAMYGKKLTNGSIIGSVKLLQSEFPQEFWMDDHSKYKSSDIFLKGSHKDFQLTVYRHDDSMDGFDENFAPAVGIPTAEFASAHKIEQTMDSIALRYNHAPQGAPLTFSADIGYQHRYGMHCAGCHAAQEKPEFSGPENHGYQAVGDFRLGLHMIPGHDALIGVEARRMDRAEHKHELAEFASAASGYDKVAVYAQDQFDLVKNVLRAVAGVRYDGKTDLFKAKTSPRASLVYTPNDKLVVRGGYSTAFRFPNFSELYQASWFLTVSSAANIFPAFPLAVFQPNGDIQPEEIRTFDIGGEYQISPSVSAKLDLYRSKVSQFIVIDAFLAPPPAPAGIGWENHPADGTVTGGELEVRANFSRGITGFANWSHQTETHSAGVDSTGTPLEFPYAPHDKFNVGVYGRPTTNLSGAVEFAWKGEYEIPLKWVFIRQSQGINAGSTMPSYGLLNIRANYDLPIGTSRPLRLSVFGNNLLNKRPEETVVGSVNRLAGREFSAQLEVHF
jgi:outer membrane receptor protein involved in Fe transport